MSKEREETAKVIKCFALLLAPRISLNHCLKTKTVHDHN